ncbi:hypothetical protein LTR35_006205 [Friedmanniomyces endolithicus]|uniref:NTF2-like domain-containing protein n=1 Tax=Friedmanniomyces endolithicus TaxID=329885 RepID=A0AAN6FPV5_9PEZI|nr:hypothetical protein LTR35_006205 [Friedmanniomyces endolithicus]KAK0301319.1 hypothetical protein LTS00_000468 [Friedmanniomyces endolithicus]KAK0322235.1 hypothetical protein LTR82_006688 [Friedmanniomyces endolithicus]KAK1014495.1 hypothetical protein LTR54_004147 [Friedmanniomyces endolithicus]
MKFTLLTSVLATAATTLATPHGWGGGWNQCVSPQRANKVVNEIIAIFGHLSSVDAANTTAHALLADNFQEFSDSVHALEPFTRSSANPRLCNRLTGSGLTANKTEWIGGIVGRPPITDIESLYISPAGCHKIIWYWQFNSVAAATYRVRGFNLIELNEHGQVDQLVLEFNSIAWELDDGELPCNFTAKA